MFANIVITSSQAVRVAYDLLYELRSDRVQHLPQEVSVFLRFWLCTPMFWNKLQANLILFAHAQDKVDAELFVMWYFDAFDIMLL